MMIIKYRNNAGSEVILHGNGSSFINVNALRSYQWNFIATTRPNGYGGVASGFARPPVKRVFEIRMRALYRDELHFMANRLHAVCEADIIAGQPGRLYLGNQYILCFLVGSETKQYSERTAFLTKQLQVLIVEPYWCSETKLIFNVTARENTPSGKKFNLRFPYRYGSGYSVSTVNNHHYAPCPAVIEIYGEVSNPRITIAGNVYNVDVQVPASARLVIDQVERQIYIVAANGERENVFNSRNKEHDVFSLIPPGVSRVLYSGEFKFSLTLVKQRSEPEWI